MYEWSEEQQMVRDAVREFVDKEIRPLREDLEHVGDELDHLRAVGREHEAHVEDAAVGRAVGAVRATPRTAAVRSIRPPSRQVASPRASVSGLMG